VGGLFSAEGQSQCWGFLQQDLMIHADKLNKTDRMAFALAVLHSNF